ncbi:MAG: DUF5103 domain-containing protein [Cyclobacteriaceae bacterium]
MKGNLLIFMCFLAFGCTPLAQSSQNSASNPKALRFIDFAYEPQIRTAVIRPAFEDPQTYLEPAVTRLGDWKLMLEFDDLRDHRDTYYARIIHCNYDWTRSSLMDLDFLNEFNEFPVNNFEFSVDTHIPYVHYWLNLPPVKLPGNYIIIVYRGTDKNDIILSKRFMVFDTRVGFENERNLIGAGNIASLNQQINFMVNYKNLDVINPLENIKVAIRQNRRWDNIATDIRPSFVREIEKQLEYRFFESDKMFKGGNEFRFFDLRSLNNPGRNVARVNKTVRPYEVHIEPDKSRVDEVYSQLPDQNGGFIPDNLDLGGIAFTNYAYVNFRLMVPQANPGNVFVTGAFNYWNLNNENRMEYDSASRSYKARILLKQGWYDYQYLIQSPRVPPYLYEGSHFQTENFYEIFVYYRPFQPQADLLVGYIRLEKNPR